MSAARPTIRPLLAGGEPVTAPLCLDALGARLIEQSGFPAAYLGGGGLGFALGVSEALLGVTEVATVAQQITRRTRLPLIVDGGVGFGDAVHAARAIEEIEGAGAAAIEIEDQVAPKRVHHHRGVEHLVSLEEMAAKIEVAVAARRDPEFAIIARTGALRNEGLEPAIARARAYRAAGADAILLMPRDDDEMGRAAGAIGGPLVAMTVAGRWSPAQLRAWGVAIVIDPFTTQVLAYRAQRDALRAIGAGGTPGVDPAALMADYRELQGVAGLEPLYAIERRTTERDAPA